MTDDEELRRISEARAIKCGERLAARMTMWRIHDIEEEERAMTRTDLTGGAI